MIDMPWGKERSRSEAVPNADELIFRLGSTATLVHEAAFKALTHYGRFGSCRDGQR
jgi:hypothetical protein